MPHRRRHPPVSLGATTATAASKSTQRIFTRSQHPQKALLCMYLLTGAALEAVFAFPGF